MNEHPTKDTRFNHAGDLFELPDAGVIADVSVGGRLVTINDCDLDVVDARALRDWLNKVLP